MSLIASSTSPSIACAIFKARVDSCSDLPADDENNGRGATLLWWLEFFTFVNVSPGGYWDAMIVREIEDLK